MASSVADALLALHAAANVCRAAIQSGLSDEQAANGQAVVDELRTLFQPRPTARVNPWIRVYPALNSNAPLLNVLPREIVTALLHRLETRDIGRFAFTCRALYRHAPPLQESFVAVVLQERAEGRGCGGAEPSQCSRGVAYLLRREWQHALPGRPPLLASAGYGGVSAFIDSTGRLLTCGTEGVHPEDPVHLSEWVNVVDDPDHWAGIRFLPAPTIMPAMRDLRFRYIASGDDRNFAVSRDGKVHSW